MGGDITGDAGDPVRKGDDDLAAHIEACIVVDAQAGVTNAVSNEDERSSERNVLRCDVRADCRVLADGELRLAAVQRDRNRRSAGERCTPKRYFDEPAAVRSAGLQAQLPEFRCHVICCDAMSARSRVAALEQVTRKEFHVCANAIGGMQVAKRLRRGGSDQRSGRCDKSKPRESHAQFRLSSLRSHSRA